MDQAPYQENESQGFLKRNRQVFKAGFVGFLILALMIPTFFISNLIDERKERNQEVKTSIANQWSQAQTISGPVLVVPFLENAFDDQKKPTVKKYYAYFMPDKLEINGKLQPELKARSIFKVPVYTASIHVKGSYKNLLPERLGLKPENLLWQEAKLIVGVFDTKGLTDETSIQWDGQTKSFIPGNDCGVGCNAALPASDALYQETTRDNEGLVLNLPLDASFFASEHHFDFELKLRGSEKLFVVPVGNSTKTSLWANWKDRDFQGNYLPDAHTLTDTGFTANWNVYRSMPPQQKYSLKDMRRTAFGVNLIQPLDNYAKTTRTIKYAILVIMLTFVVYFFIELFQKKFVNAMQYVLIGFALCLFYTLLLSISEYTGYVQAYLISALATILLISLYTKSVFGQFKSALVFGGFLSLLYAFIFVLIQLEDGALLVGSIGLFVILASIMYVSRKLDWNKQVNN